METSQTVDAPDDATDAGLRHARPNLIGPNFVWAILVGVASTAAAAYLLVWSEADEVWQHAATWLGVGVVWFVAAASRYHPHGRDVEVWDDGLFVNGALWAAPHDIIAVIVVDGPWRSPDLNVRLPGTGRLRGHAYRVGDALAVVRTRRVGLPWRPFARPWVMVVTRDEVEVMARAVDGGRALDTWAITDPDAEAFADALVAIAPSVEAWARSEGHHVTSVDRARRRLGRSVDSVDVRNLGPLPTPGLGEWDPRDDASPAWPVREG